ncbi:hypothetical protein [Nocardia sp. XZ_19_385]|uniref:hypothetical protein n=1 Tax=Nocardia sp. XZ_19_385 TaxID=2769488 RepID=UPI00188FAB0C|nr:hypothetical protein [Nocardia sp. XZ_19_385]
MGVDGDPFEYGTPGNLSHEVDGGYGEWTHEECRHAVEQWEKSTPERLAALDPDVRLPTRQTRSTSTAVMGSAR